jgi:hypothetical protein
MDKRPVRHWPAALLVVTCRLDFIPRETHTDKSRTASRCTIPAEELGRSTSGSPAFMRLFSRGYCITPLSPVEEVARAF